jgi:hypothetical protein
MVPLQDEEAFVGVEYAVVLEQRDVDADEGSHVEVEEADVAEQLGVARVEAVSFGEHSPAARVEERVDNPAATLGGGVGSPVGANSSEVDIVEKVVSKQARRYRANQIVR